MLRDGKKPPDAFANVPELRVGLQLYLEAFFDLDSERTGGEGLAPIPWTSIKDYAKAYEFDEEQTEDLFFFIRQMDVEHRKRMASKLKAKFKDGPNPAKSSRPNGRARR